MYGHFQDNSIHLKRLQYAADDDDNDYNNNNKINKKKLRYSCIMLKQNGDHH